MTAQRSPLDPAFMELALELAARSRPSPNPRVGAVVVRGREVIGRGFHEKPGLPHAEVNALREAGDAAQGADLYVTLEPCGHQGKTGPCTQAILESGIARVAIGMKDPDQRVDGVGIRRLQEAGVTVELGLCAEACHRLLEGYVIHRTTGRPMTTLKAAITLDGCLASTSGDSKWISSEQSRTKAHAMRSDSDAVLVGVDTVVKDDPLLTVRLAPGQSPLRIVLDSKLRTPLGSKIISTANQGTVILAHAGAPDELVAVYDALDGVETMRCDATDEGLVDPEDVVKRLGERGVLSLLVEGGARIHGAFVRSGVAHRVALFIAPRVLGSGRRWTEYDGTLKISEGITLSDIEITRIGQDILYEARIIG